MKNLGAVITFAAIALASPASADLVTIPIPELAGQTNFTGTIPFSLPTPPSVVRSVSLRIVATAEVGSVHCVSTNFTYPWLTSIHALLRDPDWTNWWVGASGPSASGSYDLTQEFRLDQDAYPPPFDFLLDGQAELEFACAPSVKTLYCDESYPPNPPVMHLQEVDLIIDGDFPVPTVPPTWGRIKALYH